LLYSFGISGFFTTSSSDCSLTRLKSCSNIVVSFLGEKRMRKVSCSLHI
jgi:hypothetical protein